MGSYPSARLPSARTLPGPACGDPPRNVRLRGDVAGRRGRDQPRRDDRTAIEGPNSCCQVIAGGHQFVPADGAQPVEDEAPRLSPG